MRFNRQELVTLASQPSQKFDKEGVLYLRERQDGFFRRSERKGPNNKKNPLRKTKSLRDLSCYGGAFKVNLERWCRLRGNLLFYFKSRDQWSEPLGLIVLEQCTVTVDPAPASTAEAHYGFYLVFDGGATQFLAAPTELERSSWLQAIQQASYDCLRLRLQVLQEQLELRRGQDPHLDVEMWRLQRGNVLDPSEVPICEISIACDNLLCDGNGRPPNPIVVIHLFLPLENVWIKYAQTEIIERSSNPSFLNTVCFRLSDGLSPDARVKFSALDVRERVSLTAAPLGNAVITLASIQESQRLRIPLRSSGRSTVGFLSMVVWTVEVEELGSAESTPSRAIPPPANSQTLGHRRSQSLPPRLSAKLKLPHQGPLTQLFANPMIHTYRFHSGLGGDICVQETMAESRLCFSFPQQLLGVWIQEEKELLQEVAGMGELREPWHSRQLELLDRHLQLLHLYSQAKEHLQTQSARFFKPSSRKQERSLEFAPINLHLQRMWVQNDSLKKCGFYDVITVGAFTAHAHKTKNGGLIKLVQSLKEAPAEGAQAPSSTKTRMASEAVAAIKQLRREVVEGMRTLMRLARDKRTAGMLPICEEMVKKTRTLLSVWDAGLVEEALTFVEENKLVQVVDDGVELSDDLTSLPPTLSPYRRITQQLNFELKSPDVDELSTPDSPGAGRRAWHRTDYQNNIPDTPLLPQINGNGHHDDQLNGALSAQEYQLPHVNSNGTLTSHDYQLHREQLSVVSPPPEGDRKFTLFPDCEEEVTNLRLLDANRNGAVTSRDGNDNDNQLAQDSTEPGDSKLFLDTRAMCNSPSANYYKPTDEPEPWDLTQLNIEASVMCLVSKVKFLCGRCGSPAVRLRQRGAAPRTRGFLTNGSPVVTQQPANRWPSDVTSSDVIHQAVDSVSRAVNGALHGHTVRNKFTEGLDFDSITDWTCELRPSMRKLRQAMDGLLKTARLTHSAFRVQEDRRTAQRLCNVRYRRDVCFSQALTSLVSGLMAKLWCQKPDPVFLLVLSSLGPLAVFEGLLSYHGDEIDMWGDMVVAIEDLATVRFTLSRHKVGMDMPLPRVTGTRTALTVCLPVPDSVHAMLPLTYAGPVSFHVTPVFFNVGINEKATLADTLGTSKPQDKSNVDNFERLNLYFHQFRKVCPVNDSRTPSGYAVNDLVDRLRVTVLGKQGKNVLVLHLAARICRKLRGLRFTSCKSAKDRTGMSVTLEQANILVSEFDLAEHEFQGALDCMRSQGCRMENTVKNTGIKKYAINSLQILALPPLYRPPGGTYGSNST